MTVGRPGILVLKDLSCWTACVTGSETVSLDTCRDASYFEPEYPINYWHPATKSPMCLRALLWHKTRYDHAQRLIIRTDTSTPLNGQNYDYCYRLSRWCGPPVWRSVEIGAYISPQSLPQVRPFVCSCWDLTVGDRVPTGGGSFTVESAPWEQSNCAVPTEDLFFPPLFESITSQLSEDHDGMRVAVLVVASASKWQITLRDAPLDGSSPLNVPKKNVYPEASGYNGSASALVFDPCSIEADLWDDAEGGIATCPDEP